MNIETLHPLAFEVAGTFGRGTMPQFSTLYPGFGLDEGYLIAEQVCVLGQAHGETPVGRKVGGTNPSMWPVLGATGPSWGFTYDTTVFELARIGTFDLGQFSEPRIEPEIVLHLARPPTAAMGWQDGSARHLSGSDRSWAGVRPTKA
jgi:2-oxo-3-hexenedioate decarboxylase